MIKSTDSSIPGFDKALDRAVNRALKRFREMAKVGLIDEEFASSVVANAFTSGALFGANAAAASITIALSGGVGSGKRKGAAGSAKKSAAQKRSGSAKRTPKRGVKK